MNTQQIELVQSTFALAAPMTDKIAESFYERLFTLDPTVRSLFAGDLKQQRTKLMTTLTTVVQKLHQPEHLSEMVRLLGQRHMQYGVQAGHYATVGEALVWTLAQHFGPAFTPEVEDAWAAAYAMLAEAMTETPSAAAAPVELTQR
ncbi:MAG: hypothetical protein KDE58_42565 [Caldilineaceae bacterium]|nr:hypothetical protein [Caldilineaceae bacterium]